MFSTRCWPWPEVCCNIILPT